MSLILGIYPDQSVRNQMHKIATGVVRMIESQGVPISFVDPNSYHIELFSLRFGRGSPRYLFSKVALSKVQLKPFDLVVSNVRLGLGGKLREIVYLQVDAGSDQLRDIVYEVSRKLKIKRSRTFNPSVRIARIGKDISEQETHNLINTINEVNQKEDLSIRFECNSLSVLGFKEGKLYEDKKFSV